LALGAALFVGLLIQLIPFILLPCCVTKRGLFVGAPNPYDPATAPAGGVYAIERATLTTRHGRWREFPIDVLEHALAGVAIAALALAIYIERHAIHHTLNLGRLFPQARFPSRAQTAWDDFLSIYLSIYLAAIVVIGGLIVIVDAIRAVSSRSRLGRW
jgi:hypothetical protein